MSLRQAASAPYEDILCNRVVFGTPKEVTDRLKGFQEDFGATRVVMEPNYGGQIPYDRVSNSLRLIVEEVMPYFK